MIARWSFLCRVCNWLHTRSFSSVLRIQPSGSVCLPTMTAAYSPTLCLPSVLYVPFALYVLSSSSVRFVRRSSFSLPPPVGHSRKSRNPGFFLSFLHPTVIPAQAGIHLLSFPSHSTQRKRLLANHDRGALAQAVPAIRPICPICPIRPILSSVRFVRLFSFSLPSLDAHSCESRNPGFLLSFPHPPVIPAQAGIHLFLFRSHTISQIPDDHPPVIPAKAGIQDSPPSALQSSTLNHSC